MVEEEFLTVGTATPTSSEEEAVNWHAANQAWKAETARMNLADPRLNTSVDARLAALEAEVRSKSRVFEVVADGKDRFYRSVDCLFGLFYEKDRESKRRAIDAAAKEGRTATEEEQARDIMLCRYGGEASVSHVTLSLDGNKVMATLQEFARDYVDDAALLQDAIQAVKDDAGPGRVLSSLTWHSYMKVAGEAGGKMDMHGDSNLGYSRRYVVRGCEGGGESYMSFAYVGYERPEDMYRVSIPSGHAIVAGPELLARPATHIMHGVESVHRHTYSMIVDFKEQTSN